MCSIGDDWAHFSTHILNSFCKNRNVGDTLKIVGSYGSCQKDCGNDLSVCQTSIPSGRTRDISGFFVTVRSIWLCCAFSVLILFRPETDIIAPAAMPDNP
ncbi:hypothetical protein FHS21_003926 [Phyllobacterium trifolii]|uniref:Uncharacterized protein n=1 Tax=Phyllobacterium trifolii TaxID=300193 RepID=A0A839U8S0_9HYPH|nr:hypothetical protein [Phyllobacterium trifolii]